MEADTSKQPQAGLQSKLQAQMATSPRRQLSPQMVHLVAGASGGVATAILTAPLDVLRTRLQSSLYNSYTDDAKPTSFLRNFSRPFRGFAKAVHSIAVTEGYSGFFKGLGPSMAGVMPATATKFYVYGNCKRVFASLSGCSEDKPLIHAEAAMAAAFATATLTNPIWLVKTRLQLDKAHRGPDGRNVRQYRNSLDCVRQVMKNEGIRAFYSGMSASYLGSIETVLHLVLYEQLKSLGSRRAEGEQGKSWLGKEAGTWLNTTGAAGLAKAAAVIIAYPHEVVRTRMRQSPVGRPMYTGLYDCFRTVWLQEGMAGLYGGLVPHTIRSIPSAMISLGVYEFVLRQFGESKS